MVNNMQYKAQMRKLPFAFKLMLLQKLILQPLGGTDFPQGSPYAHIAIALEQYLNVLHKVNTVKKQNGLLLSYEELGT